MDSKNKLYIPPSGPPQGIKIDPQVYVLMGQENIFKMLEDFYLEVGKSSIAKMFPSDLSVASKKSAEFFVHILGGPPIYQERHGPPMMRKRHMAFTITESDRQVWLSCFRKILVGAGEKYRFPMEHMPSFLGFLDQFSGWMVNSE